MEGRLNILTIRSLESRDVEAILEIQAACPEIAQWSAWDYDRVARGEMAGWVATEYSEVSVEGLPRSRWRTAAAAELDGEVAGFLIARRLSSELEILNFAVESEWRRCGIGAELFDRSVGVGTILSGHASHPGSPRLKLSRAPFLRTP